MLSEMLFSKNFLRGNFDERATTRKDGEEVSAGLGYTMDKGPTPLN